MDRQTCFDCVKGMLLVGGIVSAVYVVGQLDRVGTFNTKQEHLREGFVMGCALQDASLDGQAICKSKALDVYPDKEYW